MGSSRPSFEYNSKANRWEIRGKGGTLKMAIDDSNVGVPIKFISFVGSSAGIASIGLGQSILGTITSADDLRRGDYVFGNMMFDTDTGNIVEVTNFHVPSNSLLNMRVHAIGTGGGSLPASAWNIFAIRTE